MKAHRVEKLPNRNANSVIYTSLLNFMNIDAYMNLLSGAGKPRPRWSYTGRLLKRTKPW